MARRIIKCVFLFLLILQFSFLFATIETDAVKYGANVYGDCVYGGDLGDAALAFSVSASTVNLAPNLVTTTTAINTTTFSVSEKCSESGYAVTIIGNPPNNGAYALSALTSPTLSSAGTEQYGINLVANTSPSLGANPSGGSGIAATGYDTANYFKYVSGNTIASTANKSDTTTFTISFMANAKNTTPAKTYTTVHTLICTATY